jgi:hypothetical protein
MRIRINGNDIETIKRIEISEEAPPVAAWGVILIGVIACMGWWQLWG